VSRRFRYNSRFSNDPPADIHGRLGRVQVVITEAIEALDRLCLGDRFPAYNRCLEAKVAGSKVPAGGALRESTV
jgi:hypothetical protein